MSTSGGWNGHAGCVVITTDDGWLYTLNTLAGLTSAYPGVKTTNYLVTGTTSAFAGNDNWLTQQDDLTSLQALYAEGHEFGSHTHTHAYVDALTDEQMAAECSGSYSALVGYGITAPYSLGYPYGSNPLPSKYPILSGYFESGRDTAQLSGLVFLDGTQIGDSGLEQLNLYKIPCRNSGFDSNNESAAEWQTRIRGYVTDAISNGAMVVLLIHYIHESLSTGYGTVTEAMYTSFLDWLVTQDAWTPTMHEAVARLLVAGDYEVQDINSTVYHPFIDDDFSLWGIDGGSSSSGTGLLKFSDDYGDTWSTVFDFSTLGSGIARPPIYGAVYISAGGYVFAGLKHSENGEGYLYRSTTPRISGEPSGMNFSLVANLSVGGMLSPWSFAENSVGRLVVGEYGHSGTGASGNVGYLYHSTDGGENWTRDSYFVDNYPTSSRHIHECQYDPYTDVLYVTTGDDSKGPFKSTDDGSTWTDVTSSGGGGFTGLAFLSDKRVWGTDWTVVTSGGEEFSVYPGTLFRNDIFKTTTDDSVLTAVWSSECAPDNGAVYDLHTRGSSQVFAVMFDEFDDTLTHRSSVWASFDSGENWELLDETQLGSTEPVFIGISHGRNSRIPDGFPYLLITKSWTRSPNTGVMTLGRISLETYTEPDTEVDYDLDVIIRQGISNRYRWVLLVRV